MRERGVERGRLPLLLGAVLRVRADVDDLLRIAQLVHDLVALVEQVVPTFDDLDDVQETLAQRAVIDVERLIQLGVAQGSALQQQLAQVQGVHEAMVVAAEGIACLKVDMQGFDEATVEQLLKGA